MSSGDETIEISQRAEGRVDCRVIADVISAVDHRRGIDRRKPDRVYAEPLEIFDPPLDAGQIAFPVTVGVEERKRVDLVDNAFLPPVSAVLPC